MKNFIQNGDFIEFTAPSTLTSGQLIKIGDLFGVAVTDIASGARGNIALCGVFRVPKLVAAGTDVTVEGGSVYYSATGVSGASATGPLCGYAVETTVQATTTVRIMLLG